MTGAGSTALAMKKKLAAQRVKARIAAPGTVVTTDTKPAPCQGCNRTRELREGFCLPCLKPYL